jgi:hypothetical protein
MDIRVAECEDCSTDNPCPDCMDLAELQEFYSDAYMEWEDVEVPEEAYRIYLNTLLWHETSELVKKRYFNECANNDCLGDDKVLTVHHLNYEGGWGKETLDQLVCLCQSCHDDLHRRQY